MGNDVPAINRRFDYAVRKFWAADRPHLNALGDRDRGHQQAWPARLTGSAAAKVGAVIRLTASPSDGLFAIRYRAGACVTDDIEPSQQFWTIMQRTEKFSVD